MNPNLIAKAETDIRAPKARVWAALVDPQAIEKYMFGTHVTSTWKKGGPITWKGEWQGKPYEDKGEILDIEPGRRLRYSHFSPLMGKPDKPENYHNVTIELQGDDKHTHVALLQDNNSDEKAREHSEKNWAMMLEGLKNFVEDPKG
jgi:uncharacterized protein YndB with AHSA1/START domain